MISNIFREHFISNASSFLLSTSFKFHISEPFKSTLKTHVLRILILFSVLAFHFSVRFKEDSDPTGNRNFQHGNFQHGTFSTEFSAQEYSALGIISTLDFQHAIVHHEKPEREGLSVSEGVAVSAGWMSVR